MVITKAAHPACVLALLISRCDLSQLQTGVWANLAGLTGTIIGLAVRVFGNNACFYLSAGLAAAQSIIFYTTPETLDARDSKPVASIRLLLAQANPLSLIFLLLRNGPGLCALAATRVLWRAAVRVQILLSPLQLGNRDSLQGMDWKPEEQGNYNGLLMPLLNIPLSRCFTTPFLRVSGTRDVWRISTLGSALGFVLIGQVRQKKTQSTARRFCRK
jgi:hypothetical protein